MIILSNFQDILAQSKRQYDCVTWMICWSLSRDFVTHNDVCFTPICIPNRLMFDSKFEWSRLEWNVIDIERVSFVLLTNNIHLFFKFSRHSKTNKLIYFFSPFFSIFLSLSFSIFHWTTFIVNFSLSYRIYSTWMSDLKVEVGGIGWRWGGGDLGGTVSQTVLEHQRTWNFQTRLTPALSTHCPPPDGYSTQKPEKSIHQYLISISGNAQHQ